MQPLRYSSHVGAPIECAMSTVRFLNEKALSSDQLLPTTDGPAIKGKKVEVPSPKTIDAYAEAHEKPFVRLYVTNGEDYKSIKPRVQNWLSSLGEHDEWLIVHLGGKEAGGFFSRSVASILRSDFSKSKLERVVSVRMFDGGDSTTTVLEDLMVKIREGLARSGQKMINEYSKRMKALEAERHLSSFNFMSFFALKEGLAMVYESMRSGSAALGIYDELELLFGQRHPVEPWSPSFTSFGGDSVGDDSGSLLDEGKKPYRAMLVSGKMREFDFREYLFSRQAHLLFLLNLPIQVLIRGVKFIASFEDAMVSNEKNKTMIDVWAFSAFMDLAEACKASNQSLNNDPSINNLLGDAYHSAMCRLDSLGSQFLFLPSHETFIFPSHPSHSHIHHHHHHHHHHLSIDHSTDNPSSSSPPPHEDLDNLKIDSYSFPSPLKVSSSSIIRSNTPINHIKTPSTGLSSPLPSQNDHLPIPSSPSSFSLPPLPPISLDNILDDTKKRNTSETNDDEDDEGPDDSSFIGDSGENGENAENQEKSIPSPSIVPSPDIIDDSHQREDEKTETESKGEDDDAKRDTQNEIELSPSNSYEKDGNIDEKPSLDGNEFNEGGKRSVIEDPGPITDDMFLVPSQLASSTSSASATSSNASQTTSTGHSSYSEPPSFNSNLSVMTSSPSKSRVGGAMSGNNGRPKSRNAGSRTHSRNSSIGEDIFLGEENSLQTDPDSLPSISPRLSSSDDSIEERPSHLDMIGEDEGDEGEKKSHQKIETHISTFPELQMSLLALLQEDDDVREALINVLGLSEGDAAMFKDKSNSVFVLQFFKASQFINDTDGSASKLLQTLRSARNEKKLDHLRQLVEEYEKNRGDAKKSPSSHSIAAALDPLSLYQGDPNIPFGMIDREMTREGEKEEDRKKGASLEGDKDHVLPSSYEKSERVEMESTGSQPNFSFTRVVVPASMKMERGRREGSEEGEAKSLQAGQEKETMKDEKGGKERDESKEKKKESSRTSGEGEEEEEERAISIKDEHFEREEGKGGMIEKKKGGREREGEELRGEKEENEVGEKKEEKKEGKTEITITHPSLASALRNSSDFDKLYKTVALKANEAFVGAKRARSSTRIKTLLGNLSFARQNYSDTLKFFDDTLINIYISEGWDRMVFTLYNKIAECYKELGNIPLLISSLICLLVPKLSSFSSLSQRESYQNQFELHCSSNAITSPLYLDISSNRPLDLLISLRASFITPNPEKKTLSSISSIAQHQFYMGEMITISAKVVSNLPKPFFIADKFYVTFEATNPKTGKVRTFHVGSSKLKVMRGEQTVLLRAQFSKGNWVLASYSFSIGKVTITTRYKHPGPIESHAQVMINVASSPINATLSTSRPISIALSCSQFIMVKIDSNSDSMKEALIVMSYDSNVIKISEGRLKATLKRKDPKNGKNGKNEKEKNEKEKNEKEKNEKEKNEKEKKEKKSPSSSSNNNNDGNLDVVSIEEPQDPHIPSSSSSNSIDCHVAISNRTIVLPDIPKRSSLLFFLPLNASIISDDLQTSYQRDLQLDLSYRKASNEKKTILNLIPLPCASPLKFEHSIVPNDSNMMGTSSYANLYFVAVTVTNVTPNSKIRISGHSTHSDGDIVLTQDYAAALNVDKVDLEAGDFTTVVFGVSENNKSSQRQTRGSSSLSIDLNQNSDDSDNTSNRWITLTVLCQVFSNIDETLPSPISTSYNYLIPFKPNNAKYKVSIDYEKGVIVGRPSKMNVSIYLPQSSSPSLNPKFASFFRVTFDPSQWVISGRTFGKLKNGYTDSLLSIIPLTAIASPPCLQIEEFSNISDPKSKIIVPSDQVAIKYSLSSLLILPPSSSTDVCREILGR